MLPFALYSSAAERMLVLITDKATGGFECLFWQKPVTGENSAGGVQSRVVLALRKKAKADDR